MGIDIDVDIYIEPVAHNYGLLSTNHGLLWGIMAYYSSYLAIQV